MITQPLVIGYSLTARLLHWATALAIFIAIPLAIAAENAMPADKGRTIFLAQIFRCADFRSCRHTRHPPPDQRRAGFAPAIAAA